LRYTTNNSMDAKETAPAAEDFSFELPDFEMAEIDLDGFDLQHDDRPEETRYQKPRLYKAIPQHNIKYSHAQRLARELRLEPGGRANVIVNGAFVFGDFIEAYMTTHNIKARRMIITTLSMNQENVDSLANLINGNYIDQLDLIISHFFYSHERHTLIPYLLKTLDIDNRFQLSVSGAHTKTVIFDTLGGKKMVMHGSANLRSSNSVEQFTIEDNPELFDFYEEYQTRIIDKYKTINKPALTRELWDIITTKKFK